MMIRTELSGIIMISLLSIFWMDESRGQSVEELNNNNISLEYHEVIDIYTQLDAKYSNASLQVIGTTDIGRPLHLFVINKHEIFEPADISRERSRVLYVNNGIHPGEPDGIDASVRFATALLENANQLPGNLVVCIVPVFNIGGALNRGCCSRANQNGPKEYGFRGNARNLDLNRDFIKCESTNTQSLVKSIRAWDPDVFIDTHVSNGADYQYTMTLLTTQLDKLGGELSGYLRNSMLPKLYSSMENSGNEMIPYVNTKMYGSDPRTGLYDYMETPRYASGFCALFGTIAFVTETHMLKPFNDRVDATLAFLRSVQEYMQEHGADVSKLRKQWKNDFASRSTLALKYTVDSTKYHRISFKGFESFQKKSPVTDLPQIYYNNKRTYNDSTNYYNYANSSNSVNVPSYYIIPVAWKEVAEKLKNCGIKVERLERDVTIEAGIKFVTEYKTVPKPYEGQYLHSNIKSEMRVEKVRYYKGDYKISTAQPGVRYIVETLEPEAEDSFFAWGYFDGILQQKEWFSAYVFDGYAEKMLKNDKQLKGEFGQMKKNDPDFAGDAFSQLYFLYKRSPLFERSLNRYPVGMIYK